MGDGRIYIYKPPSGKWMFFHLEFWHGAKMPLIPLHPWNDSSPHPTLSPPLTQWLYAIPTNLEHVATVSPGAFYRGGVEEPGCCEDNGCLNCHMRTSDIALTSGEGGYESPFHSSFISFLSTFFPTHLKLLIKTVLFNRHCNVEVFSLENTSTFQEVIYWTTLLRTLRWVGKVEKCLHDHLCHPVLVWQLGVLLTTSGCSTSSLQKAPGTLLLQ